MKKIIKVLFKKISRIIYFIYRVFLIIRNSITPIEFKGRAKLKSKIEDNLVEETFNHFKDHFKNSMLFSDIIKIREYAIKSSLQNDKNKEYYYLEFGVWEGRSANFLSKFVNKLYCFDSFEGLKEDWVGTRGSMKGTFSLNKKVPLLNSNIEPIVGWVEDTLEDFLKKHNPKINFVHLDMDTYSPTKFTLEKLKPYLVKDAIILFDELYNYIGWENGEYKALREVFKDNEFEYKAFRINHKQCVIQLK